jgi:CheY-like chemotaxis protein
VDRRIDGSLENGSLSVLVVDDDDLQRQFLARLLARAGIGPLFWATNGRSALEAFREGQAIDVVVCDLLMPEMDGIEFLKQVSDEGFSPSIVISSGADEDTQREMEAVAHSHGLRVLGFIPKPVSVDALLTVLARHGSQDAAAADTPSEPAPEPEVDPARRTP